MNTTITGNAATTGGGIYSAPATMMRLDNTIVAANTGSAGPDIYGAFSSSSRYNIIGFDPTLSNGIDDNANGNRVGGEGSNPTFDAHLKPLGDYGGSTLTHPPHWYSDAVDQGDNVIADDFDLTIDQRGFDRLWHEGGDVVDIGAVELAFDEF